MDAKISDQDIAKVATKIQNWKHLSPFLELTDVEEKEIENSSRGDYLEEKRAALRKWRQKGGKRATYETLIDAAREADNEDLAEYVQSLAQGSSNKRKRPRLAEDGNSKRPRFAAEGQGAPTAKGSSKCAMTCFTDWMKLIEKKDYPRAAELWVEFKEDLWFQGQKLKVEFLDKRVPPTFVNTSRAYITKEEILDIANEWHRCGQDVVPEFVECKFGDVPDIQVKYAKGVSESIIGTGAIGMSPSMRLDLSRQFNFYKRTIRHEFGHALGLMHEHQHPDAPEQYDEEKLRVYLISKGVDESEVDDAIKYQWRAVKSRKVKEGGYDKHSVMHYLIPEDARKPGPTGCYRENLQTELSEGDKKYIVQIYLKAPKVQEEGVVKEDSGTSTNPILRPLALQTTPIFRSSAKKMSEPPKLKELVEDLHKVASKWQAVGVQLEVPTWTLKEIDYENRGDCSRALSDMLDEWINNDPNVSWEMVVEVLKSCSVGERALARDIETKRLGRSASDSSTSRRPTNDATLPFLQSLPTQRGELSIVQRCATNYSHLGIFLLNDDDGTKIRRIELANHYKPEAIMMVIFEEWIASGNNSWRELIECLKMCSLNTLARDIRDALRHNEVSV